MVTGANTTDYVLDGTMAVQDVVNGAAAATYLAGPRGPEYRRDDETGAVRWYVCDGLGSVVGEVAPDGSLTCTRKLDVYGCVRSSSGTATSKHKFVGSLGHPSDDETGLIYMRARHYDPVTGRFVSEDPALHGMNWFCYVSDNPTNQIDMSGREGFPWDGLWDVINGCGGSVPKWVTGLTKILASVGTVAGCAAGLSAAAAVLGSVLELAAIDGACGVTLVVAAGPAAALCLAALLGLAVAAAALAIAIYEEVEPVGDALGERLYPPAGE